MVIPNTDEQTTFPLKTIARTRFKSLYRLLFGIVHWVFLSQTRTYNQITIYKFRIMTTVFLNLKISWARQLLANIKEEAKKIVLKFNNKGVVTELSIKNCLNFCTKIHLSFWRTSNETIGLALRRSTIPRLFPRTCAYLWWHYGSTTVPFYRRARQSACSFYRLVSPTKTGQYTPGWTVPHVDEPDV